MPESAKTEPLYDLTDWLGLCVRSVDSSLIEEWQRLRDVEQGDLAIDAALADEGEEGPVDITKDARGFSVLVRNAVWQIVRALAFRKYDRAAALLAESEPQTRWSADELHAQMKSYWDRYDAIDIGPDARSPREVTVDRAGDALQVRQTLLDPDRDREWALWCVVDIGASRDRGSVALGLRGVGDAPPAPDQ